MTEDSKTPEQMAEEYAEDCYKDSDYPPEILRHTKKATASVFLAGYQAAKDQVADADKVIPQWNSTDAIGDAINRSAIQHAVAELKTISNLEWISVKERLPEIPDNRLMSDDVLWLTRYGEIEVSCLERLRSEFRVDWGDAGLLKLDQFTHWMPLPEPPKGK